MIKTACYVPNIICNRRNRDPKVSRGALVSRVGFGRKGGFLLWILYLILNIKSVFPFPSHQSKGDFVFLLSTSTPCKSKPISFLRLKFGAVLLNTFPMGRDLTGQSHLPGQVYTWSPLGENTFPGKVWLRGLERPAEPLAKNHEETSNKAHSRCFHCTDASRALERGLG